MTHDELKLVLEALQLSAVTVDSFGVQKKPIWTQEHWTEYENSIAAEREARANSGGLHVYCFYLRGQA